MSLHLGSLSFRRPRILLPRCASLVAQSSSRATHLFPLLIYISPSFSHQTHSLCMRVPFFVVSHKSPWYFSLPPLFFDALSHPAAESPTLVSSFPPSPARISRHSSHVLAIPSLYLNLSFPVPLVASCPDRTRAEPCSFVSYTHFFHDAHNGSRREFVSHSSRSIK